MPHTIHSIRRDPFARASLMRERIYCSNGETCAECGSVRRTLKARAYLWRYWWSADSAYEEQRMRMSIPACGVRAFCSVQCFETFYS